MSAPLLSRRSAMLNTLAIGAGALLPVSALLAGCKKPELVCTDTTGLSSDETATRATVKYVDHTTDATKPCSACQQYKAPPMTGTCGGCVVVKGPIHPDGGCTVWAKKVA